MGEKVNKEKEETMKKSNKTSLVFAINGERFELDLSSIDPSTTLIEFLRNKTPFKSVKLGCGEGGCGACVVLLSKYDPLLDKVDDFTISSCLTLLCSIDGCSITTSEGLGNSRVGFHAVHERIAGFHATQCGFCTPGMSVSMFSALLNADKSLPPRQGCSNLTAAEAEKAVAGNLCRCTGYRPLVDACKSFSADVDIEDLGFNAFCKKGDNREEVLRRLPCYDHASSQVCTFPEFLKDELKIEMNLDSRKYRWSSPVSVSELQGLLEAENSLSVKLVAGNTSTGCYKEEKGKKYERFIDIRQIPELTMVRKDEKGVELGAVVTISKAIEALREKENGSMLAKIANHMEKIANRFVRNTGTIGGNIMMAQRKQFPSDLTTILLAARATVNIMTSSSVQEQFTLEEFLQQPPLDAKSVLLSVEIPSWFPVKKNGSSSDSRLLFETYRAAPRPLGNALPFMNAAFSAEVSLSEALYGIVVYDCRLAFGAYGTKHAHRARKVEEFLAGKVITDEVLMEAIGLIKDEIVPDKGTSNLGYRSSLAVTFLFEFFGSLTQTKTKTTNGFLNGGCKENGFHQNGETLKPKAMLSSAQQIVENEEHTPVGKGIVKAGACLQASGEAVYVDDIPSPENCLYGALIYSTMPLARIKSIRFKENRVPEGVFGIITYKDIPKGGKNIGATGFFAPDMLFAEEITHGAGQIIALLVADSQKRADIVANLVVIDYDTTGLEPPILSLEEAVEKSSLYEVPVFLRSKPVGDITKGMAESEHKILGSKISLGSQYFFYMETQTALAVPDEDNCMVVYSSTQAPEFVHRTVAGCLGVPEHNVRVITRRLGGGFGGKVIKAQPVAAACALAASKMQRPVRTYLNRKTDMITTGGRHPMKVTYSVGFKSNGKITALDIEVLLDAGLSEDVSPLMPSGIEGALMKYDWGAFSFDIKLCKTNRVSRTAVRAPGDVQGSYIAEAIIEKVASYLSVDVDEIRKVNLHTYESLRLFYNAKAGDSPEYTLPLIWDKLTEFSGFNQRRIVVDEFNASNKWRKRGIARVPALYGVSMRATPGKVSVLSDGSIAVEVQGIEMGQGLWTKVKQMAAYSLGLIQCGTTSDELLQKIRVIQSDTLSMVQGSVTGGSTTSEMSSEAVRMCCNGLVERLLPVKNTLVEQTGGPVTWDNLISQAYRQGISMSVSTSYLPDFATGAYLNYGVAASEVEVNILTGETTILRSDIIYDCGKSLNPAVDLGQIEGAFVQGVGFFMLEEYLMNSDGLVVTDSTWTYKIPTVDTIPRQFNVEILNSGQHKDRVLSSKASGEPPLLLASSVHCAVRAAVKEARNQMLRWSNIQQGTDLTFDLPVPATMPVVKESCGLNVVEKYLEWKLQQRKNI